MAQHSRTLTPDDIYFFEEGSHSKLADVLGAHHFADRGGTQLAVWAPNAQSVSVIGDFNGWNPSSHPLHLTGAGIWQSFIQGMFPGARYKYHIQSKVENYTVAKTDPFAFLSETPPQNASV